MWHTSRPGAWEREGGCNGGWKWAEAWVHAMLAGDGYLANVSPSDFTALYEAALPESISGKEWLAAHDEHWDSATQVTQAPLPEAERHVLQEA